MLILKIYYFNNSEQKNACFMRNGIKSNGAHWTIIPLISQTLFFTCCWINEHLQFLQLVSVKLTETLSTPTSKEVLHQIQWVVESTLFWASVGFL